MSSPALQRKITELQLPTALEKAVREVVNAVDAREMGAPEFVNLHLDKAAKHLRAFEAQAEEEAA